jgi:hypothetical protein
MAPTVLTGSLRTLADRAGLLLGQDFRDVRLHRLPARAIGGLACTIAENVFLAHEADRLPPQTAAFVLAHELAHVAQKRHGASAPDGVTAAHAAALEAEADHVAARLLAGRPARVTLADAPLRPAFWGPLGHYYTSYYIMVCAGVDKGEALARAFFCQLPDQVREFDATSATMDAKAHAPGESEYGDSTDMLIAGAGWYLETGRATPPGGFKYVPGTRTIWVHDFPTEVPAIVEDPASKAKRLLWDRQVVMGLHCLNDTRASEEQAFRTREVEKNWGDIVLSGLALHPFGDSFAHVTSEKRTYGPDHGHLFAGHAPDTVTVDPDKWIAYARALYDMIPSRGKGPFKPIGDRLLGLIAYRELRTPSSLPYGLGGYAGSTTQKVRVQGEEADEDVLKKLKVLMSEKQCQLNYHPEDEAARYWGAFAAYHQRYLHHYGTSASLRKKIEAKAVQWAAHISTQ